MTSRAVCDQRSHTVQQLAKIFSTRDHNFQCLGAMVEGGSLMALRVESHRFVEQDDATVSDDVKVTEYPVSQITGEQGAVLDGAHG